MKRSTRVLLGLAAAGVAGLSNTLAGADPFSWATPADGLFSEATNWSPNSGPPGAQDTAVFDVGVVIPPFDVKFSGETTNMQSLIGTSSLMWDLVGSSYILTADPTNSINNSLIVGVRPDHTADLTVSSGALLSRGSLIIGDQFDGGSFATGQMRLTGDEANPCTFLQGDDSVFTSDFRIGGSGKGMLNMDGFASVRVLEHAVNAEGTRSSAWVVLGEQSTGVGIMNITGANASFDLEHAPMVVGDQGSGEIYLNDGAQLSIGQGELWLAMRSGSTGVVQVRDPGSSLIERSDYTSVIGNGGSGTLLVENSGYADLSHLRIGGEDAATNHAGTGTMIVSTWGLVECDDAAVAPSAHEGTYSTGSVKIIGNSGDEDDDAATWNVRNTLAIGGTDTLRGGKGTLRVEGTSGFVRVAYAGTSAAGGGSLILWGDAQDTDDDGLLDLQDGRVVVGSDVFADPGTLRIANSGILDLRGGTTRLRSTSGTGTLELGRVHLEGEAMGHGTIDGHVWVSGGTLTNVSGRALTIAGQIMVGWVSTNGYAEVRGTDSLIHVTGRFNQDNVVGVELGCNDGTGIFNISEGGHLKIDWGLVVGGNSIGAGTLNLSGEESRLTVGHDITIGREAAGTIEISQGGQLEQLPLNNAAGMMYVGGNAPGVASVRDSETQVSILRLDIGNMASGEMTIEDGAYVHSEGQLLMGRNGGPASLTLRNGATLETGYGNSPTHSSGLVGSGAPFPDPGLSEVTIDDASWWQTGVLSVGFRDGTRGKVTIQNWGLVVSEHGVIGRLAGSEGEVIVTDEYTNWNCGTGEIGVGGIPAGANIGGTSSGDAPGGVGRLLIADSAQVSASRIKVFPEGTLSFRNGTANGNVEVDGVIEGTGYMFGSLAIGTGGTMRTQLASESSYDALSINSAARLDGTLQIELVDAFVPPQGSLFTILTASEVVGTFAALHGRDVNPTTWLVPLYDSNAVQLGVALPGDANLDGEVDSTDFDLLVGHHGMTSVTWLEADFTGDGKVNTLDFNLLAGNFGLGFRPPMGAVVPEPAGALLLLFPFLLTRRRRA